MTERALPAVGAGTRTRPAVGAGTRSLPRPGAITRPEAITRPAVHRKEAILNTPSRAGMLIGASAAIYAVTLAGVAGLQAQSDAQLVAQRAPFTDAVTRMHAANDQLEATVAQADAQARALVADYATVGQDVSAYQARLDSLAALVAEVKGSAAALPARIKLPSVSMHGAVGGSSRPATRATTSASAKP